MSLTAERDWLRDTLAEDPDDLDARLALARIELRLGAPGRAAEQLLEAARRDENRAELGEGLACLLAQGGANAVGADTLRRLAASVGDDRRAALLLVAALRTARHVNAAATARSLIATLPPDIDLTAELLTLLHASGDGLALDEHVMQCCNDLFLGERFLVAVGARLRRIGEPVVACAVLEAASARMPATVMLLEELAASLSEAGRFDEALTAIDEALLLEPASREFQATKFRVLFAAGRHDEAWKAHDALALRGGTAGASLPESLHVNLPLKLARALPYGAVLPMLSRGGQSITVACSESLRPLVARSLPGVGVSSYDIGRDGLPEVPAGDWDARSVVRAAWDRFASAKPEAWLRADPERVEAFRRRLRQLGSGPRIGFSWRVRDASGCAVAGSGRNRVEELMALPGIQVVALDGVPAFEWWGGAQATVADSWRWRDVPAGGDLDALAALLCALDAVVTVDNEVAHLAGALGVPVLVLTGPGCNWIWSPANEHCPWYPALSLTSTGRGTGTGKAREALARMVDLPGGDAGATVTGNAAGSAAMEAEAAREVAAMLEQARTAEAAGNTTTAVFRLREVLQRRFCCAEAWAGLARLSSDDAELALASQRNAAVIAVDNEDYWIDLAAMFRRRSANGEAVTVLRRALQEIPDSGRLQLQLGTVLWSSGAHDEAADAFAAAAERMPDNVDAWNSLGVARFRQGRLSEATSAYHRALAGNRERADIWSNLGLACYMAGESSSAERAYRRALEVDRGLAMAHYNYALLYHDRGELDRAIDHYRAALESVPSFTQALNNLGNALTNSGLLDEAVAAYREALRLDPAYGKAHSNLLYCLNYVPDLPADAVAAEHAEFRKRFGGTVGSHVSGASPGFDTARDADRVLRIGLVSPDFRSHSVAYFLVPLLERASSLGLEVYCYSNVERPDGTTRRLTELCGTWRDIAQLSDDAAAARIREDDIDILIDLAGHTRGNRLGVFARVPAPVQATYLGYPNSAAVEAIRYRICDGYTDPPACDRYYAEQLVRMQDCFLCYAPPRSAPPVSRSPVGRTGNVTFACFNDLAKINEGVLDAWGALLQRVPGSRLKIKSKYLAGEGTRRVLSERMSARGMDLNRVALHPWTATTAQHLAAYHETDIALDTFPYSGVTTTCEALWMGLPVVTLAGEVHAGRTGVSILSNIGHPEWIAGDVDEYVDLAARLAADHDALSGWRRAARRHLATSRLLDRDAFAAAFATICRDMWHRWGAGIG